MSACCGSALHGNALPQATDLWHRATIRGRVSDCCHSAGSARAIAAAVAIACGLAPLTAGSDIRYDSRMRARNLIACAAWIWTLVAPPSANEPSRSLAKCCGRASASWQQALSPQASSPQRRWAPMRPAPKMCATPLTLTQVAHLPAAAIQLAAMRVVHTLRMRPGLRFSPARLCHGPEYGFLRRVPPDAIVGPGYTFVPGVGILGESCDLPASACTNEYRDVR